MISSPEREVNGTPSARQRVCRLPFRPKGPAAPLRRTSVLPEAKPWRRVNSLHPSILISHGIPKRRTRRLSCPSFWERATRLELASRHPANGWPPFAGPLPRLRSDRAFGAGWRQRVRLLCKKQDIRNWMSCFTLERATRLELASRHPANGWPPFAGPLPRLRSDRAFGAGWRQRVRLLCKKQDIRNWMSCFTLERATRLELATSTLARWRSTR